ncbi:hypothetical protein DASC09_063950 [Saccharomycopsis crataegensis]|uniref:J domain-containing protein n=1 Tax=Saccharomycopsis crataegensis TaxID=43959 RepID=A0AAV5QWF5_9ASCO|nr:hypothetical protein DASC09_063950 [Saccharomycopsis crataegensis]
MPWKQGISAPIVRAFHTSGILNISGPSNAIPSYALPLRFAQNNMTHYEMLGISPSASHRDIKRRFKQLSKVYHPDIVKANPKYDALSDEEKKINDENYIKLVASYEILSDAKRRLTYDLKIKKSPHGGSSFGAGTHHASRSGEYRNQYYGEAKYYSRSRGSHYYSASGLNFSRNRVHYGEQYNPNVKSTFHGMPNSSSKYDVPHFDYDAHLKQQLRIEEMLLKRKMEQMGEVFGEGAEDMINGDRRYHSIYQRQQKKKESE